jgi:CelD/BcsL family acetyltransferase involved in cellulose biosynthesis
MTVEVTFPDEFPDTTSLPPVAPQVGPFPHHLFLNAWWQELAPPGRLLQVGGEAAFLGLVQSGGLIEFAGEGDLTDYHSPLGWEAPAAWARLASWMELGMKLNLDSLPWEAAEAAAASLSRLIDRVEVEEYAVAMVMDLPAEVDGFYQRLDKKERHELRRKRRRYQQELGEVVHSSGTGPGWHFDEFVRLHRLSPGKKSRFLTGARERFFRRLASQPGWRTDTLEAAGAAVAALFGYLDTGGYYLYNSAFDPAHHSASPGIVALLAMLESLIEQKVPRFDFLKGDERYKLQMGARPRPLFRVAGQR